MLLLVVGPGLQFGVRTGLGLQQQCHRQEANNFLYIMCSQYGVRTGLGLQQQCHGQEANNFLHHVLILISFLPWVTSHHHIITCVGLIS